MSDYFFTDALAGNSIDMQLAPKQVGAHWRLLQIYHTYLDMAIEIQLQDPQNQNEKLVQTLPYLTCSLITRHDLNTPDLNNDKREHKW